MKRLHVMGKLKKTTAIIICGSMVLGCAGCSDPGKAVDTEKEAAVKTLAETAETTAEPEVKYIAAPYAASNSASITDLEYLEPKYYKNDEGEPAIGVTTIGVIEKDGKYFKDSDNDGELDTFEDWREAPEKRVVDLTGKLSLEQKLGQLVTRTLNAQIASGAAANKGANVVGDLQNSEEAFVSGLIPKNPGIRVLQDTKMRHVIQRANPSPSELALYNNALQQVAEWISATNNGEISLPVIEISNARNHNSETLVGFSEATGVFATYPGTLGLAAAALGMEEEEPGSGYDMISTFAEESREEWKASGIRKGYIYMADILSDPRWTRAYETFGEKPEMVAEITKRLVEGFQDGINGVNENSIAMTVKHFPGGGARENGTDPHKNNGRWNVYYTENSLNTYHLPAFKAAIEANASSIMPYYAMVADDGRSAKQVVDGYTMTFDEQRGMAFSSEILQTTLRETLGFKGYVNSDTGICGNRPWGIDEDIYDYPARAALAINAGIDMISDQSGEGFIDMNGLKVVVERWEVLQQGQEAVDAYCRENGISDERKEYLFAENAVLSTERVDEAASHLLKEAMLLGLFENPYAEPEAAEAVVESMKNNGNSYDAHQKSVVLLKNAGETLPMTKEKADGKKVFIEYMTGVDPEKENYLTAAKEKADGIRPVLNKLYQDAGYMVTEAAEEADYALIFIDPCRYPSQGTTGYLPELQLGEDMDVPTIDEDGVMDGGTRKVTNVVGFGRISEIAEKVHENGGKVMAAVNMNNPWILDNLEPECDALIAHFDTYQSAILDVVTGVVPPVGKLPISVPANSEVVKVENKVLKDHNGNDQTFSICVSPNDVPGYDKDQYMDAEVLRTTRGNSYTYQDTEGNSYGVGFGLGY